MILLIIVHDFEAAKHTTNKHVICLMYSSEINENDRSTFVEIFKEIHLIDNFKIKFFYRK